MDVIVELERATESLEDTSVEIRNDQSSKRRQAGPE